MKNVGQVSFNARGVTTMNCEGLRIEVKFKKKLLLKCFSCFYKNKQNLSSEIIKRMKIRERKIMKYNKNK